MKRLSDSGGVAFTYASVIVTLVALFVVFGHIYATANHVSVGGF